MASLLADVAYPAQHGRSGANRCVLADPPVQSPGTVARVPRRTGSSACATPIPALPGPAGTPTGSPAALVRRSGSGTGIPSPHATWRVSPRPASIRPGLRGGALRAGAGASRPPSSTHPPDRIAPPTGSSPHDGKRGQGPGTAHIALASTRRRRSPAAQQFLQLVLAIQHRAARLPVDLCDPVVAQRERMLLRHRVDDGPRPLLVA